MKKGVEMGLEIIISKISGRAGVASKLVEHNLWDAAAIRKASTVTLTGYSALRLIRQLPNLGRGLSIN